MDLDPNARVHITLQNIAPHKIVRVVLQLIVEDNILVIIDFRQALIIIVSYGIVVAATIMVVIAKLSSHAEITFVHFEENI